MANSIQLKFVIKTPGAISNQFYSAQVGLGITSVLLAAFIGKPWRQNKIDTIGLATLKLFQSESNHKGLKLAEWGVGWYPIF